MHIQVGYEMAFSFPEPTALVLMLHLHPSLVNSIVKQENLVITPRVPVTWYYDLYGNQCNRAFVPAGRVTFENTAIVHNDGKPDVLGVNARQHLPHELPDDVLVYLLASRYCEVDSELRDIAWAQFGKLPAGWVLVQAVCDFVHHHIKFDYMKARANRTALDVYREKTGVCRDFMHLAITFCRCLNIPARYCTGYLGDIGVSPSPSPMDFSAWFEVYLGGTWYPVDARNNVPRIGRVLMARGRDAADVALMTSFGVNKLESFEVSTKQV